jgi:hypothetical protein
MNNNEINSKLIDAYKNAKKLIKQDPNNKQFIIKNYIDLVLKFNNYSSSKNNNDEGLPSSSDINIYNNFNTNPNNMMNGVDNIINNTNKKNKYVDITKTSQRSIQELASIFNYINK